MRDFLAQDVGLKYSTRHVREFKRRYAQQPLGNSYDWLDNLDHDTADKDLLIKTEEGVAVVGKTSLTSHFFAFWLVHILVLREMLKKKQRRGESEGRKADDQSSSKCEVLPIMYEDLLREPARKWAEEIAPFCRIGAATGNEEPARKPETSMENRALTKDSQRQSDHSRALRDQIIDLSEDQPRYGSAESRL